MSRIISTTTVSGATITKTTKRTGTRLTIDNNPLDGLSLVIEYSDVTTEVTTPAEGPATAKILDVKPVEAVRVPGARLAALPCFAATSHDLAQLADDVSAEQWPNLSQPQA